MKSMGRITAIICALCGLAVVGAVFIWAPTCPGTLELANGNLVPMRCAYTGKVAALLGLALFVLGLVTAVTGRSMTVAIVLVAVAMIVVTFESPLGIGVCRNQMPCWTTAAWIRACAGVGIVSAILGAVLSPSRKKVPSSR